MAFLKQWRSAFGQRLLLKKIQANSKDKRSFDPSNIQRIVLVGSGSDADQKSWEKAARSTFGKTVTLNWMWLCTNIKETQLTADEHVVLLSTKDFSFFFHPKMEVLEQLQRQQNQLLIGLDENLDQCLLNLMACAEGVFRVGKSNDHAHCCEFMLDMKDRSAKAKYLKEALNYIKLMNPS